MSAAGLPLIVGVLGGMGPEATVELMRRVIQVTPARDDQDHIRMLIEHNPKVPSRIEALIDKTGESPAPVLVDMAMRLEAAGASVLAMPCNTAHAYAGDIRAAVQVPLLDMIALTAERISRMLLKNRRVGMLASTAVRTLGLYERALEAHGLSTVYPGNQDEVMGTIKAVKRGDTGSSQRLTLQSAADDLNDQGADILLIACTELSVLADALDDRYNVLDALDVLVEEIVACGLGTRVPASTVAAADEPRRKTLIRTRSA